MSNELDNLITGNIIVVGQARQYLAMAAKHVNSREIDLILVQLINIVEHQSAVIMRLELELIQEKLRHKQEVDGFADMKKNLHLMQDLFTGRIHDNADLFQYAVWWRDAGDPAPAWKKMAREFYLKAGADHAAKELSKTYPGREYRVLPIGIDPETD